MELNADSIKNDESTYEVWETARELISSELSQNGHDMLDELFGDTDVLRIMSNYNPVEVARRLENWNKKHGNIVAGNIVSFNDGKERGIVTCNDDGLLHILWSFGECSNDFQEGDVIKVAESDDVINACLNRIYNKLNEYNK